MKLAEREGFEPSVRLHVRLISSQVQSTTLPPLRNPSRTLPGRAGNHTGDGRAPQGRNRPSRKKLASIRNPCTEAGEHPAACPPDRLFRSPPPPGHRIARPGLAPVSIAVASSSPAVQPNPAVRPAAILTPDTLQSPVPEPVNEPDSAARVPCDRQGAHPDRRTHAATANPPPEGGPSRRSVSSPAQRGTTG